MNVRPITKEDYKLLLQLDIKVYPTDNPVSSEILDQWFQNNPEFGMIFEENTEVKGMLIIIPLTKDGWTKLINGNLAEADLNGDVIFNIERDNAIGLHGYHMEKLDPNMKQFYNVAFKALANIIDNLKSSKPNLEVCGFSGLCVTSDGINLCYNKFNCRERDYLCSEHILKKGDELIIVDTEKSEDVKSKLDQGYQYVNRCKMLVTFPEEISIVWRYFN